MAHSSLASTAPPWSLVQETQGPGEGRHPIRERDAVRVHSRDLHHSVLDREGGIEHTKCI